MKKSLLFLTVILVVVSALTFSACSNVPRHLTLQAPWDDFRETATYDVTYQENKVDMKGSMTVTYERYKGRNIATSNVSLVPDFKGENFHGYVVTTNLRLDDGQFKESIVITDSHLKALYSLSKSHLKNRNNDNKLEDLTVEYKYNNKGVDFKVSGNETKNGSIKYKPFEQMAYFDNAFYIALTRTMAPINMQSQVSFLTPSYREGKMMKRGALTTSQIIEIKPNENLKIDKFEQPKDKKDKTMVSCYRSNVSSGETMPGSGTPIVYFVSAVPYTTNNGNKVNNVLLKFIEHNVTYMLKDIELTKVTA